MSYPTEIYHSDSGQVSAVARLEGRGPDLVIGPGGTEVSYLATGTVTEGQFGLYRWTMTGPPSGPSPHFHKTITESFFVLSGTIRLFNGDTWIDGRPGDFLYVPAGGIHAFSNTSGEPASMLLLFTPGAPREAYFEALAEYATSGRRPTDEEMADLLRHHDQYPA